MMGEREAQKLTIPEEEEGKPLKKGRPGVFTVKNIVILVAGVAIASALAILTVGNYIAPSIERGALSGQAQLPEPNDTARLDDLAFFKLDPLIVNPAGSDGERYLKAAVTFEMYDAEIQQELDKRLPQIKNQVNNVLSSKTVAQLQTIEDREKLGREILKRVNGMLVSGRISNVYFEEYVIQ